MPTLEIERPGDVANQARSLVGKDDVSQWAVLAGLRFILALVVVFAHLAWIAPS